MIIIAYYVYNDLRYRKALKIDPNGITFYDQINNSEYVISWDYISMVGVGLDYTMLINSGKSKFFILGIDSKKNRELNSFFPIKNFLKINSTYNMGNQQTIYSYSKNMLNIFESKRALKYIDKNGLAHTEDFTTITLKEVFQTIFLLFLISLLAYLIPFIYRFFNQYISFGFLFNINFLLIVLIVTILIIIGVIINFFKNNKYLH